VRLMNSFRMDSALHSTRQFEWPGASRPARAIESQHSGRIFPVDVPLPLARP